MKFILTEKGPISGLQYITLNNPSFRNIIHPEMLKELDQTLDKIEKDKTIKIIILNGSGKSFSAGLDLPSFVNTYPFLLDQSGKSRKKIWELIKNIQKIFLKISLSSKIYIASMHKHVYGAGLDLITFCDIRIAADNAKFSIAETNLGIVADLGSLNNLPYLVGRSFSNYMAMTGIIISAEESYKKGLLDHITKNDILTEETLKIAKILLEKPGDILKNLKRATTELQHKSLTEGLDYLADLNSTILPKSSYINNILSSYQQ